MGNNENEKKPLLTIITVCFNAQGKLEETLKSVRKQTFRDYEVIVKDGGSLDGSLACIRDFDDIPLKLVVKEDAGIYDAMNEAVRYAKGEYVYFLNCGDVFAKDDVLEKVFAFIKNDSREKSGPFRVYYGNIIDGVTGTKVSSNPRISAFTCYRNVPCHQACIYSKAMLDAHPFDLRFRVRADYEQFLWAYFKADTAFCYMDLVVAEYEGGGYSEQKKKRSAKEHERITAMYMSPLRIRLYRFALILTFAPLRKKLASNKATARIYNGLKGLVYRFRR